MASAEEKLESTRQGRALLEQLNAEDAAKEAVEDRAACSSEDPEAYDLRLVPPFGLIRELRESRAELEEMARQQKQAVERKALQEKRQRKLEREFNDRVICKIWR